MRFDTMAKADNASVFADSDSTQLSQLVKRNLRILFLEDDAKEEQLLLSILDGAEFQVILKRVDSEQEFLFALNSWHPDLVISDYTLPSYNGMDALRACKQLLPDLPFIFYSGTIGEEAAIEALKLGASDYALKDRPKRLPTAIRRTLEEVKQQKHQKETEKRILSQARLLDMATDAIISRDLNDKVRFWNKGAERLYGYSSQEIWGRKSTDFLLPPYIEAFQEAKRATVQTGHWEGEMENIAKDQRRILVTSRWTLLRDEGGHPEGILAINTDITEKRKLETQLLRAQRLECVGTLASGVAHDLNNVLAPILMGSEMLRQYDLSEEVRKMLEMIASSAGRGAEVVKQLLTFVRGAEGKRTRLHLVPLLRDAHQLASTTFPKNITVSCDAAPDLWSVIGDPTQIHQVLMNLCINARDAMPNGGRLQIKARNVPPASNRNAQVLILIEDSGTGMPAEVLEKIFDPFFTTKSMGKGTGLGLPIVMGIIQSHQGTINASSQPGQGTTFEILLPAEPDLGPEQHHAGLPTPGGKGELILLVDDEPEIRSVMTMVLSKANYEVISAENGNFGILRFVENKDSVRLVITDMMMPGVDGISLASAVQAIKPQVKIIGTSGLASPEAVPHAKLFLKKPFSSGELLQKIHEALAD